MARIPNDLYDWVAVKRAVDGEPVGRRLSRTERAAVAEALLLAGWTQIDVIRAHGYSAPVVSRIAAELRTQQRLPTVVAATTNHGRWINPEPDPYGVAIHPHTR